MNDSKIIAMRSVAHLAPDTPQMNAAALPAFGVTDGSDDQIIRSLSSALEAAECGQDRHCAEALRVAIAVRFAGLRAAETTAAAARMRTNRKQASSRAPPPMAGEAAPFATNVFPARAPAPCCFPL